MEIARPVEPRGIKEAGGIHDQRFSLPSSVRPPHPTIGGSLLVVIHVDGAIGGITPQRQIFVTLFSERAALPTMIEFELSSEGILGEEKKREGREGLVREMDIGVMLSIEGAQQLAEFLQKQLQVLKESVPEVQGDDATVRKVQ